MVVGWGENLRERERERERARERNTFFKLERWITTKIKDMWVTIILASCRPLSKKKKKVHRQSRW